MEERLYKGYWWLPSKPEDEVPGVLTIKQDGTIVLELLGAFGLETEGISFDRKDEEVIYGRCYDSINHMKDISLMSCRSATTINFSSTFPLTRFTCRYAFIGIHAESINAPVFFEADVFIDELAHWCPPDNVQVVYRDESITLSLDTERGDKSTICTTELVDGIKVSLAKTLSYLPDYPKVSIEQDTCLEIKKEGISASQIITIVSRFEQFLSLATLHSSVEHSKMVLRSRERCQEIGKGENYYHPIELISYRYYSNNAIKPGRQDYLFFYKDIEGDFEKMWNLFFPNKQISQIWTNLTNSFERKRVYSSNDFLTVVQALDGYSIRFRDSSSFLQQLKALRNEFSSISKVNLSDEDLMAAKDSRHYYSHILKLEDKEKRQALDGSNLFYLTRKLRVLLICCALNFLGLDNAKINQLLDKCNNSLIPNN